MNQEQLIELLNELMGDFKMLNFEEGLPIVFLFDENHDNEDNCIVYNIHNAKILIEKANVQIIGVESLGGGTEWDEYDREYIEQDQIDKSYEEALEIFKSGCTMFADNLSIDYPQLIQGVECIGMFNKIHTSGPQKERHPLNVRRSQHFLKTLTDEYCKKGLVGNLILNCGMDHNSDIERFIKNSMLNDFLNVMCSVVRINTFNL